MDESHPLLLIKKKGNYRNIFYEVNLLVIRLDRNGKYCESTPCKCCINFMNSVSPNIKINKVYYFDKNGKFCCEKLKNMKTDHISNGYRKIKTKN